MFGLYGGGVLSFVGVGIISMYMTSPVRSGCSAGGGVVSLGVEDSPPPMTHDLLIDVALAIASRTAHLPYLVAGELVARVSDSCAAALTAVVLYPAKAVDVSLLLAVYDANISHVRLRG